VANRVSGLRRFIGVREALIVVLAAALVVILWRADAVAQERDALDRQLLVERQARAATELSLNALKYRIASGELNDDVQETIIDEKIAEAQQRAAELERETEALRREKVREADCVTPRSIREASGL
jgi:ABC-type phosphate transport system auxiliary subunit